MSSAIWDSDVSFNENFAESKASVVEARHESVSEQKVDRDDATTKHQEPRAGMEADLLFVEPVQHPETEFASKAFLLMQKIVLSDNAFAQGLLVLPKSTPLYRYADSIHTAAQMGVIVRSSPRDELEDGARELYVSYIAARQSWDKRVSDFSESMQQRKQELLRDVAID